MKKIENFSDAATLESQLVTDIISRLKHAITQKGEASLVVSGGRTPIALFQQLSLHPIQWDKVFITLADERWVATDTSDSNEYSVRSHLLRNFAHQAHFVGLKTDAATANEGCLDIEQKLRVLPKPFDVVILGMGDDGHTASLFPCSEHLAAALDRHNSHHCMALMPNSAPFERITLTLNTLLNSKQIYIHIVGENKKQVLDKATAGDDIMQMPIRAILQQQQVPVSVFWSPA